MENKKIQLLKRILEYIQPVSMGSVQTVYITPAQRLRQEADRIEQQDEDFQEFNQLINQLEMENKPTTHRDIDTVQDDSQEEALTRD